jgi:hypothetical protein
MGVDDKREKKKKTPPIVWCVSYCMDVRLAVVRTKGKRKRIRYSRNGNGTRNQNYTGVWSQMHAEPAAGMHAWAVLSFMDWMMDDKSSRARVYLGC